LTIEVVKVSVGLLGSLEDLGTRADMNKLDKELAHPKRRKILQMIIENKKMFLRQISTELGMPTSTAAYHLKRLQKVGLLEGRRGVYHMFYLPTAKGRELLATYP
jgi:DNA-binding transcriptional ArsR family regulator